MNKKILTIIFMVFTLLSCKEEFEKPILTLKGSLLVDLNVEQKYVEEGFSAYDKVDGDISNRVFWTSNVDTSKEGIYHVEYFVINSNGIESAKIYRTVRVRKSVGTIKLLGEKTVVVELCGGKEFLDSGVEAKDFDGKNLINSVKTVKNIDSSMPGKYWIKYYFTDSKGYYHETTRDVILVLPDFPIIVLKGDGNSFDKPLRLQKDITPIEIKKMDPGYRAFYKPMGEITHLVNVDYASLVNEAGNVVNTNSVTTDSVYLKYRLSLGSWVGETEVIKKRFVKIVEDGIPPVISFLKGNLEIKEVGSFWTVNPSEDIEVSDNVDSSALLFKTVSVKINKVDGMHEGAYIIEENYSLADIYKDAGFFEVIYSVIDSAGNKGIGKRYVQFVDTKFPEVIFNGNRLDKPVVITQDLKYGESKTWKYDPVTGVSSGVMPDPTSTDNANSYSVQVLGDSTLSIDTRKVGRYITTFKHIDPSGNESPYVTRYVTVSPPPNAPVVNGSFEDYIPDVGFVDDATGVFTGWKWRYQGYMVKFAWSAWSGYSENYKPIRVQPGDDPRFEAIPIAVVTDSYSRTGVGAAMTMGSYEAASGEYIPGTSIFLPGKAPGYIVRTMGTLTQKNIFVFKNVQYKFSFWFRYGNEVNNNQNLTYKIFAETPELKIDGADKKEVTVISNVIERNMWYEGSFTFSTNIDGEINVELFKHDISGSSRDSISLMFDDIVIEPISYLMK